MQPVGAVIVAHFEGIESGRKKLADRGTGTPTSSCHRLQLHANPTETLMTKACAMDEAGFAVRSAASAAFS